MRRSLLYVSLLVLALPVAASAQIRGAWSALVKGDLRHHDHGTLFDGCRVLIADIAEHAAKL